MARTRQQAGKLSRNKGKAFERKVVRDIMPKLTGWAYWKRTQRGDKQHYVPDWADGVVREQAGNFLWTVKETLRANRTMTKGEYQLTDALKLMLDNGVAIRTENLDRWLDCGTQQTLLSTNNYLVQQLPGGMFVHPDSGLEGSTARASSIMEDCMLIDTIIDNCIIMAGAQLRSCYIHDEIVQAGAKLNGYVTGR